MKKYNYLMSNNIRNGKNKENNKSEAFHPHVQLKYMYTIPCPVSVRELRETTNSSFGWLKSVQVICQSNFTAA